MNETQAKLQSDLLAARKSAGLPVGDWPEDSGAAAPYGQLQTEVLPNPMTYRLYFAGVTAENQTAVEHLLGLFGPFTLQQAVGGYGAPRFVIEPAMVAMLIVDAGKVSLAKVQRLAVDLADLLDQESVLVTASREYAELVQP